mmetsp:Transcript_7090/g.43857  ORF Transcript_7090/g.43857 Transcript_7090/m.43857 type:complete len:95 (+) Transcript_7090:3887-4171(+)
MYYNTCLGDSCIKIAFLWLHKSGFCAIVSLSNSLQFFCPWMWLSKASIVIVLYKKLAGAWLLGVGFLHAELLHVTLTMVLQSLVWRTDRSTWRG